MSFRPFTDVWILARSKTKYFGAYPAGFLLRARDLLNVGRHDQVLHVCSGKINEYRCGPGCKGQTDRHFHGLGDSDLRMDLDPELAPDLLRDAALPASYYLAIEENPQIQAVMGDPPYTPVFAKEYAPGPERFVTTDQIVKHSIDILPIGGRVGVLSLHWPRYPKGRARQIALVAVYVGNGNLGRTFAVFERTA